MKHPARRAKRKVRNTSAKGARLERLVVKYFKAIGADLVVRSAASKSPVDVVAIHEGAWILIQCKSGNSGIGPAEKKRLEDLAIKLWCKARVALVDSQGYQEFEVGKDIKWTEHAPEAPGEGRTYTRDDVAYLVPGPTLEYIRRVVKNGA